jgi:sterol desaturase/sphingolipid hydroxylase (fatty acid hydroxylase superfamily)
MMANLSCGIGQQVLGLFLNLGTVAAYGYVYDHWRLFSLPTTWWMWVLLFLGVDFSYYWFHRLSHEINFLWAAHVVHHQSEDYNLSVALRQSWFQQFFSWLFYIPLAWLGFHPFHLLTVAAFNTLYQFWIHTELIGRLGPLEWLFNTPSHHRVHHGSNPEYIDRNHGGTLIIWDRLFGTFEPEKTPVVYGITAPLRSFNPFTANIQYWQYLIQLSRDARNLKDKLLAWLAMPGWRPAYLGGREKPRPVSRESFVKYDVSLPKVLAVWLFVQFGLTVALAAGFLFSGPGLLHDEHGLVRVLVWAGLILVHLAFYGYLLHRVTRAQLLEPVRLLLSLFVGLAWMSRGTDLPATHPIWIALSLMWAASLALWFLFLHQRLSSS